MTHSSELTLKERKQEVTKEVILRALADVVLDEGVHSFSVQTVADRAGVSHRTVYRHFPSREDLLDGLASWIDDRLDNIGLPMLPTDPNALAQQVTEVFERLDDEDRMVRALSLFSIGTDFRSLVHRHRTETLRQILRAMAPDLPEDDFEARFAVLRSVASSYQWFILRQHFGIPGERSGPAVARATSLLIEDLRTANSLAKEKNRS